MRKDSGTGFVTLFARRPCKCGLCRPDLWPRTPGSWSTWTITHGADWGEAVKPPRSLVERIADAWTKARNGWRGEP